VTVTQACGIHGLLQGWLYLLYVDDDRTSQEPQASTACYGDRFTFLYVDDVRTPQETHLWTSTTCYRDNFTFLYIDDVRTSQETLVFTVCYGESFPFYYLTFTFLQRFRDCILSPSSVGTYSVGPNR
jgi:hypothetical protein